MGFYDLFINGTKITKGYLAPYISNTDHIVYYDTYDVSPYLQSGENVIAIMLGDGFQNLKTKVWDFIDNIFNSAPKLSLSVTIKNEKNVYKFNACDFKCKKGPIWFNDLRSGVFYDKSLEDKNWKEPGFHENDEWHKPIVVDKPRGTIKACQAEPIAVTREIKPVSIKKGVLDKYVPREDVAEWLRDKITPETAVKSDGYLYDFGENNAGIFRLKIKGFKGQRIDIQCGEQLTENKLDYNNVNFYPDGYCQRDIYILGGEDEEVFEPMFTYHGFRYLYISGITEEQATEDLLTYLVMSSRLPERGNFNCSNNIANTIYQNAKRSDISNFYYFPTDCPQREKNGWTGDAHLSAEHMMLTLGAENSFNEWLNNIRCAQDEKGRIPGIVPTCTWGYDWGNGPAWDGVLFELPYVVYKYRGDTEIIVNNASAMMRYLDYISKRRNDKGIISFGLGDWLPVGRDAEDYEAPLGFTDSVMVYKMCVQAEEMFDAVNLTHQKNFAHDLGYEIKKAIREEYINFENMVIESSCQTAQSMGIFYNIFEPDEKTQAFQMLLEIINRDNQKITCGCLGTRVLFHVLSEFGEPELAFNMITGTEYPSYGYFLKKGATTLPEQFLPDEKRRLLSQNHHFLGDIINWYMRYPGGIHIINHKEVKVKPIFIDSLNYAESEHILPDGKVKVRWDRINNQKIKLYICCPNEVSCKIEINGAYSYNDTFKSAELNEGHFMYLYKRDKHEK